MTRIKVVVAEDEVVGLGEYLVIVAAVTMMRVWSRRTTLFQLFELEIGMEEVGLAAEGTDTSMEEGGLDSTAVVVGPEGEGV